MKVGDVVRCKEIDTYNTLTIGELLVIKRIYGSKNEKCDLINSYGGTRTCYLLRRFELDNNYQRRKKLEKINNICCDEKGK